MCVCVCVFSVKSIDLELALIDHTPFPFSVTPPPHPIPLPSSTTTALTHLFPPVQVIYLIVLESSVYQLGLELQRGPCVPGGHTVGSQSL